MKLSDQCCTPEQAQRLKELGIAQDASYFLVNPAGEILEAWMLEGHEDDFCACFTVAELGQMLPQTIHYSNSQRAHIHFLRHRVWEVGYRLHSSDNIIHLDDAKNEAEARAAVLIYLLENNLVQVSEVNERLKG